ncbi:helix-turn-helix transcriptional regulator (plasmid) [Roseobacteraceae bacterium NS-SX3]
MPVHIVGEGRLLRDMFLAICLANDYETGECCRTLESLPGLAPRDMVLLFHHGSGDGLLADLRAFRARQPGVFVILVTGEGCAPATQAALGACAEAVIPERKSADALLAALKVVQDGYRIVLPDVPAGLARVSGARPQEPVALRSVAAPQPAPQAPGPQPAPAGNGRAGLSERERLILAKLMEGATNKSIANELGICEATVKVHLRTCFRKIGARNRTQAALWASEQLQL